MSFCRVTPAVSGKLFDGQNQPLRYPIMLIMSSSNYSYRKMSNQIEKRRGSCADLPFALLPRTAADLSPSATGIISR